MSDSAQLFSLVSTNGCENRPPTPPVTGVTDRASGKAVNKFMPCTIGCAG